MGLYTHDETASNRLFYVRSQKILFMKCLGPPESKWNHQVFQVSSLYPPHTHLYYAVGPFCNMTILQVAANGCMGGRRVPAHMLKEDMDTITFHPEDSTVSRVHFEVHNMDTYRSLSTSWTVS